MNAAVSSDALPAMDSPPARRPQAALPARLPPARTYPARRDGVRLLAVDPAGGVRLTEAAALPGLLRPGDVLVVNDAATIPASLHGRDQAGRPLEVRLAQALPPEWSPEAAAVWANLWSPGWSPLWARERSPERPRFLAVVFGAGDWRQRTEDRPPPPPLAPGDRLRFGSDDDPLDATVAALSPLSPRLVELRFDPHRKGEPGGSGEGDNGNGGAGDAFWGALYRHGRPVQYAHLDHPLPLWAVQNVYAGRPFAFEMPSAGRPLSWQILLELRRRGVRVVALTHAAGLSATGDPALDARLPLPERFEIPAATAAAVTAARRRGGRVVAVGTTVVRALEGAHQLWGELRGGAGVTDLRLAPGHRRRVVDGLLSGLHDPQESHFALLGSFADPALLRTAHARALTAGLRSHELGDLLLVLPAPERSSAGRAR